jgi:hypothetical protein
MTFPVFSAGEVLRAQDMNAVGLWLVGSTTFATTATPFINGCFTSDYENYRVLVNVEASTGTNLRFRVRSGTSTPESGLVYDRFGFSFVGSITNQIAANENAGFLGDITNVGGNRTVVSADVFNPNAARPTEVMPYTWGSNNGTVYLMTFRIETNTAYTGLELYTDSGTLTGSMRVYGYRN